MKRRLRLVTEGGNLVEPQPAKPNPNPRVSVDADLVDVLINVLDLLITSRRTESLGGDPAGGCPSDGHPKKPSKPTKTKGAQRP